ncbi:MAG: hypothetical protein Q9183_001815, partial [Haloplaca sp. 2 TL-2023]
MAPSQLKRLKSSLRDKGITGPQKSKKQKRQASKNGAFRDTRLQRNAALEGIREHFNPFEVRAPVRSTKYDVASNRPTMGKGLIARPGVTKGLGEENRRQTLLKEMHRRKKVGGIQDRRFGENNPTMTPEEKALERFVREKQKGNKKDTMFDLEDGDDDQLTHFGQSLSFDNSSKVDNFHDVVLSSEDDSDVAEMAERPRKRRRLSSDPGSDEQAKTDRDMKHPIRPKTKKEVMEEVIAKSKLHKYERQQAKEDDDDLRAELDEGMPDLLAIMRGTQREPPHQQVQAEFTGNLNPDRAAMLNGKDRAQAEKDYDERLRQMAFDQRSRPSEKTLTEEEKVEIEARRLGDLEQQRLYRMRGDQISEEEQEQDEDDHSRLGEPTAGSGAEELHLQGLGTGLTGQTRKRHLDVEDEDDFVIEDDLVAVDSELIPEVASSENDPEDGAAADEDEEFVEGIVGEQDTWRQEIAGGRNRASGAANATDLAYLYKCPQNHQELLEITRDVAVEDQPTIVQRIRALYHPKLQADNKAKLEVFSKVLVEHICYLAETSASLSFVGLESLIRHVHSLAKMFPEQVGRSFRVHLKAFIENRPLDPNRGDLVIFTAISTIFPTSDHFHQVVTPAMLAMGLYLGQKVPQRLSDLATGLYLSGLCSQYQKLSKRYMPEVVNYTLNALYALAPAQRAGTATRFPVRHLPASFRLKAKIAGETRKLRISDTVSHDNISNESSEELKKALLHTLLCLMRDMAAMWTGKSAHMEVLEPMAACLRHLSSKACMQRFNDTLKAEL